MLRIRDNYNNIVNETVYKYQLVSEVEYSRLSNQITEILCCINQDSTGTSFPGLSQFTDTFEVKHNVRELCILNSIVIISQLTPRSILHIIQISKQHAFVFVNFILGKTGGLKLS